MTENTIITVPEENPAKRQYPLQKMYAL